MAIKTNSIYYWILLPIAFILAFLSKQVPAAYIIISAIIILIFYSISLKKIEYIAEKGQQALYELLLPVDSALKDIPKIRLADKAAYYLSLGQSVTTSGLPESGQLRIYNSSQQFIGLGEVTEDGKISPKRLINIG